MHSSDTGWLWTPPSGDPVPLPAVTRKQVLPLQHLGWENFERLCLRLAAQDGDVEQVQVQRYGLPGQRQHGIDLLVRHATGQHDAWQCKRRATVTAAQIRAAVDKFLKGKWARQATVFHLCVTADLADQPVADEIARQAERLRKKQVTFVPLGADQLSLRLKDRPDLVDDFFGREWVGAFCGVEAANTLGRRRLDRHQIVRLRHLLREYYRHHFASVDPGLPAAASPVIARNTPTPLEERFVVPDVAEPFVTPGLRDVGVSPEARLEVGDEKRAATSLTAVSFAPSFQSESAPVRMAMSADEMRKPATAWVVESDRNVLLGAPGIGKSTLLRALILDLLSPSPRFTGLAERWGRRLPVWVPFAMWSRMVAEDEERCSLKDVLAAWLHKMTATRELEDLVLQALEDERLLLLVDGLDEFSDETPARTALGLLETFAQVREIPVVATSRPLGYQRLGGPNGSWRLGVIKELSEGQQRELARIWFTLREEDGPTSETSPTPGLRLAERQADQFMAEILRDPALAELAAYPLMLSGLIALSLRGVELPRSRFKAHEELTRLLLQDHPQRREKAALSRRSRSRLSAETRDGAIARLAFAIHSSVQVSALDIEAAKEVVREWLMSACGKSPIDAHEAADELLTVGAESVGILVEKSQRDVGFIHLAFQEFLAARYVGRLPFAQQKELILRLCPAPRWREVILCVFHLNERADEVDDLIDVIENAELALPARLASELLLAEVAFSDLHCSPEKGRSIAAKSFVEIEAPRWMPLRAGLLERAVDGLRSDPLRGEVESQVRAWFPQRVADAWSVYEAMSAWPRDDELFDALLEGMASESAGCRGIGAELMARYFSGDLDRGERLRQLIHSGGDAPFTAALLYALWQGWPTIRELADLLDQASQSGERESQIVGCRGRIEANRQTADDRAALIERAADSSKFLPEWGDVIAEALAAGWPDDPEIKGLCLDALRERGRPGRGIHPMIAAGVLVRSFPADPEAAEAFSAVFQRERFPQQVFGDVNWPRLAARFPAHPALVPAVDAWLERQTAYVTSDISRAVLVSMSDRAKRLALDAVRLNGLNAAADALIVGWGVEDPEVSRALRALGEDPEGFAAIADHLPAVLEQPTRCRQVLLDALAAEGPPVFTYVGRICRGLITLGCNEHDQDVVEACLRAYERAPHRAGQIFHLAGRDRRVRDLALAELAGRCDSIADHAHVYADDPEIRSAVRQRLRFLPTSMRRHLVGRLALAAGRDERARELLDPYAFETDSETGTSAVMAFYKGLAGHGQASDAAADRLQRDFESAPGGIDLRLRAFAGLFALRRLDVLRKGPPKLMVYDSGGLVRELAASWDYVEETLGPDARERLELADPELEQERILADPESIGAEEVARQLDAAGFRRFALSHARSEMLRTVALAMLHLTRFAGGYGDAKRALAAAEVLGEQFTGDRRLSAELAVLVEKQPWYLEPVLALCEVDPTNPSLTRVRVNKDGQDWLIRPTRVFLACALDPEERLLVRLRKLLSQGRGEHWEFPSHCARAFGRRVRRDRGFRQTVLHCLTQDSSLSANEKAGLARVLTMAGNEMDTVLRWCGDELERAERRSGYPEMALDPVEERFRPLAHVLLDILVPLAR